jgi:3-oxoacyl-[acyl-carrier-protein] synthase III
VRPDRLLADLERVVDPSARVVSDIGEHMLFALHYLTARTPDAFHLQLNLGSMGSGIAGSIGLALADRSRPVVCIAGDGGMQMAGMEALVALRERLPILRRARGCRHLGGRRRRRAVERRGPRPPRSVHSPRVADCIGARRALALEIDAACASGVVALELARAYLESGLANVVLITQSHIMLRIFPLLHPACPGLGDAASAFVVARGRGLALRATFARTHGEFASAVTYLRGRDDATDTPWWCAGGEVQLGSRAPAQAKQLMRDTVSFGAATVREVAARACVDVQRIGVLASVQPRGFVPGAIAEHLGLPRERAVATYGEIAHVGGCGPAFNLQRARALGLLAPGAIVALYAQGAGFTRAAALLEVTA